METTLDPLEYILVNEETMILLKEECAEEAENIHLSKYIPDNLIYVITMEPLREKVNVVNINSVTKLKTLKGLLKSVSYEPR